MPTDTETAASQISRKHQEDSPQLSDQVTYYQGRYNRDDAYRSEHSPFLATGYGTDTDLNPITYLYHPKHDHSQQENGISIKPNFPFPDVEQRRNAIQKLKDRIFPLAKHFGSKFNSRGNHDFLKEEGVAVKETGLHFVVGQDENACSSKAQLDIPDGNQARLYVAALDKAAETYAREYRVSHAHVQDVDDGAGHSHYINPKEQNQDLLKLSEVAAETALIKRSMEMNLLDPAIPSRRNSGALTDNIEKLMPQLLNKYVGMIAAHHCGHETPVRVDITEGDAKSGQFNITGFCAEQNSRARQITFKQPLRVRLIHSDETQKFLNVTNTGHGNQWVLESVQKLPGNDFTPKITTIGKGNLDEKGLSELFILLGKQPVVYGEDRSDYPSNKPNISQTDDGKLFTKMVDSAFDASVQCEIDIPYKGNKLSDLRQRLVVKNLVQNLEQMKSDVGNDKSRADEVNRGLRLLDSYPIAVNEYQKYALAHNLPPVDKVTGWRSKGTIPPSQIGVYEVLDRQL